MQNTNQKINIETVIKVVDGQFPEYWGKTEACLATVATLLLEKNANPTSLILIGQPSTGKTTILDFFSDEKIIYRSDYFTPKAFVSHYADKTKGSLSEIDLLKRIEHKCLIVPDLGVIWGKRKDDRNENLGILTRALDGNGLKTDSGVHGHREYSGKCGDCMFCMLCGTTPFGYEIWDDMGRFGSRLLFLRMSDKKCSLEVIKSRLKSDVVYLDKKQDCQKVINEFLSNLWQEKGGFRSVGWDDKGIPDDVLEIIINLANLLVKLRGTMGVWENNNNQEYEHDKPNIENPARVTSLLLNMAKGRAIIYGRNQIGMEDMPLLIDITLSSCPDNRGKLLRTLLIDPTVPLGSSDVCRVLNISPKTALKLMENMKILGIVKYIEDESGAQWGIGIEAGRPARKIILSDEVLNFVLDTKFLELFSQIDTDV